MKGFTERMVNIWIKKGEIDRKVGTHKKERKEERKNESSERVKRDW